MFKLSEVIIHFNQTYQKKVKLNKTWGLFYLQPESLKLLNKNAKLIQDSVYCHSHFITNRKKQHESAAETKSQPVQDGVSALRDAVQKMNDNKVISDRFHWEDRFLAILSNDQVWLNVEQKINQKNESLKQRFSQVRQSWNIHKPFQYHSSKGLLDLLNIIVGYQDLFLQAYQELQQKKQTWISFVRIPPFIAEAYESFLEKELKKFKLLRKQVLDALLLRLKTAEQQGLVTCDDASYTLALQSEWLSLTRLKLPEYRTVLDPNTFNHMQRAIEKHGDESHISQLYQLAWYQGKNVGSTNELTTVMMSGSRLLMPNTLFPLMSKKKKKWFWFSWNNNVALQFLEKQQALLAQLSLQPAKDMSILEPIYTAYPALLTLSTQYQLLQQSIDSLNQQPLYWWQWEKKFWKKVWKEWLVQQLDSKQAGVLTKLNKIFEEAKKYNLELRNVKFCKQVQVILETIQTLMNQSVSTREHESLLNMFQYIAENSKAVKRKEGVGQMQGTRKASPQINNGKDSYGGKSTGSWSTKFLPGKKGSTSTEKKPENEPASVLTRGSTFYK